MTNNPLPRTDVSATRAGQPPGGGLLAHVVSKFTPRQWENIATESLRYLLAGNASAAPANLLRPLLEVPDQLHWHAQSAGEDTGIPDLVADDDQHRPVMMIEGKFWAALTPQQPLGYLRRQATAFRTPGATHDDPGVSGPAHTHALIFLVPTQRQDLVAGELADQMRCDVTAHPGTGMRVLDNGQLVVVVSWESMLGEVEACLRRAGDLDALTDLAQLRGLCDRADQEAMLPFAASDFDTTLGRRLMDFHDLTDRVASAVSASKVSTRGGMKTSSKRGRYGTFQRHLATNSEFMICFSAYGWATYHHTPLFVRVHLPNAETLQAWRTLISSNDLAGLGGPDGGGYYYVALRIPTGVEQHVVVEDLTEQALRALGAIVASSPQSHVSVDPEADEPADDPEPEGPAGLAAEG